MGTFPMRRPLSRGLLSIGLLGLLLGPVAAARGEGNNQKKVLVLYSIRRDTQLAIVGDRELPKLLERGLERKPDVYFEYIDAARFPEATYKAAFGRYFSLKYRGAHFDLVIAFESLAIEFVALQRDDLFADTPVVFVSEDRSVHRIANSAGIVEDTDFRPTVTLATRLQPDTRQVFVVVGNSNHDKDVERMARAQFESVARQLKFTYLSDLTTEELERRLGALPEHSIIYFVLFYQDAAGVNVTPVDYLERLAAIANRPMYSWIDSAMNRGIVGGSLVSLHAQIDAVATLALRVLHGEQADSIPLSAPDLRVSQVDWRQLQRWGISEARAPSGTIINFREASAWVRYKPYILGASALLLAQSALIAGLIVQSVRRRRAEDHARRSESDLRASYERIRDLGARLIAAQEAERSRIARELHDDIVQQVALLGIHLELLARDGHDRQVDVDGLVREALEHVHGIANSIRALSHRLHPARLGLVGLVPALRGLQRELERPDIAITFSYENTPATLPPDLTLCLFRIVQEALQNAVKHSGARQVSVNLSGYSDGLALTIKDNGAGFDVDAAWGKGLGLVSMIERLEVFGGSLKIRATPGNGTRLEITVPLSGGQAMDNIAV
jgi:signal transduction histidine kinase/predicted nucleic acid-binding OB-fold protein